MSNEEPVQRPLERLVGRLEELSDAVTKGRDAVAREFTMRVPAEPERDADLVLSTAAAELRRLCAENERLRAEINAAYPAMLAFAASNPRHPWRGVLQDPCGVHGWMERNTPNA